MAQIKKVSDALNYNKRKHARRREVEFSKPQQSVRSNWEISTEAVKPSRFILYILVVSLLFLFGSMGVFWYIQWSGGDRVVTSKKINIIPQGPTQIESGEIATFNIRIANRNPIEIKEVVLAVTYPDGTFQEVGGILQPLKRKEFSLGTFESNEIIDTALAFSLFGEKEERKKILFDLEYRVDGSSRKIGLTEEYEVTVNSTVVQTGDIIFSTPIVGKEITFTIPIQSNSKEVLPVVFVQVQYPSEFTITRTQPVINSPQNGTWRFSNLEPSGKREIQISGFINTAENVEKSIIAEAYIAPTGESKDSVLVAREEEIIQVKRAFVETSVTFENIEEGFVIVSPDKEVEGEIYIRNNDTDSIKNARAILRFEGSGVITSSIRGGGAYYDEALNALIWDIQGSSNLESIARGAERKFTFSFQTSSHLIDDILANKKVIGTLTVEAERISTARRDSVRNTEKAEARVQTGLEVTGQTLYGSSIIKNAGPIPPQVNTSTQYVLNYFIKNSGNTLSDIQLEIPLQRNTKLTGITNGVTQNEFSYDEDKNTVYINLSNIQPIGSKSSRSIEVQVQIDPDESTLGKEIELTKQAFFSARDDFTRERINRQIREITTDVKSEDFPNDSEKVVEQ